MAFTENYILLAADISEKGIFGGYLHRGIFHKACFLKYADEKTKFPDCVFSMLGQSFDLTAQNVRDVYPQIHPFLLPIAVCATGEISEEGVWAPFSDDNGNPSRTSLNIGTFLKNRYGSRTLLFMNRSCAGIMPIALAMGLETMLISFSRLGGVEFTALRKDFLAVLQKKSEKKFFTDADAERESTQNLLGLYAYLQKCGEDNDGIYTGVYGNSPVLSVNTSHRHAFPIFRVPSFLMARDILLKELDGKKALVVLDGHLDALYGGGLERKVREIFENTDYNILKLSPLEDGGEKKDAENLEKVIVRAMETALPRDGVMIGIGGVILDTVGFAAQQYRRMVSYYRIPTTLVGQIDAGVGIKVGINYKSSKNLLGSFYPPSLVINCTDFLFSLPQEDFVCGISEILKAGIADCPQIVSSFSHAETAFSPLSLRTNVRLLEDFQIITDLAIQTMMMNLHSNFYEQKELRRLMDFGHTFSPIIEGKSDYRIPHGFAVAIDMFICIYISRCLQLISEELFRCYQNLFEQYDLLRYFSSIHAEFREIFEESVHKTILHRAGNLNLVIPTDYGRSAFLNLAECKNTLPTDYVLILEKQELRILFEQAVAYIQSLGNGGNDENLCL
ncbi:MAG: hypothetical protein IJA86_06845 [Clostridia bacterium]|nr:hypothetical protein [Clostridia bacterium]